MDFVFNTLLQGFFRDDAKLTEFVSPWHSAVPAWCGASGFRPVVGYCGFCLLCSTFGMSVQGPAFHPRAITRVSGASCLNVRSVFQGCGHLSMACATSFCFTCRISVDSGGFLCVSHLHFSDDVTQARLPVASALGCAYLSPSKSTQPMC